MLLQKKRGSLYGRSLLACVLALSLSACGEQMPRAVSSASGETAQTKMGDPAALTIAAAELEPLDSALAAGEQTELASGDVAERLLPLGLTSGGTAFMPR